MKMPAAPSTLRFAGAFVCTAATSVPMAYRRIYPRGGLAAGATVHRVENLSMRARTT